MGVGNCLKYLKRGCNTKKGRRKKDFKKGGGEQDGSRGGCLKKGGWNPLKNYGYVGPTTWNSLPLTLRNVDSFSSFKFLIKNWEPTNCPCSLSRNNLYIAKIGFANVTH